MTSDIDNLCSRYCGVQVGICCLSRAAHMDGERALQRAQWLKRDPSWEDCHCLSFWVAFLFTERSLLNRSNMILRQLLFTVQAAIANCD